MHTATSHCVQCRSCHQVLHDDTGTGPVQFMFITHGVQLVVGLGPVVLATIEHHGVVHLSSPDNCIVYEEVRSVLYFQGILRGRGSMRRPSLGGAKISPKTFRCN